jgi:dolichol-phosphate mannosyltransferase/undecaprenyl-phosphate 4-deoxy-4-formamido-L-arabinose transferase
MKKTEIKYSVIIPLYKSGEWLDELVLRLEKVFQSYDESFELILVNDASPDEVTWSKVQMLAFRHKWIRGFDMLYNIGQHNAIICGIEKSCGDYIITMDDDLQHPPEEIPKLINSIISNPDIMCVMGLYASKQHSLFRNFGSWIFRLILRWFYGKAVDIKTSSFRIMRRELAEAIACFRTVRPSIGPITIQLTRKIMNVLVEHHPRQKGRSGYTLLQLVSRTIDAVIYTSTLPLRLFSILGFFLSLLTIIFSVIVFFLWESGHIQQPGYTSVILLITFFSGTILMGIGVVGEYISRVVREVSGPEKYKIIRETTNYKRDLSEL